MEVDTKISRVSRYLVVLFHANRVTTDSTTAEHDTDGPCTSNVNTPDCTSTDVLISQFRGVTQCIADTNPVLLCLVPVLASSGQLTVPVFETLLVQFHTDITQRLSCLGFDDVLPCGADGCGVSLCNSGEICLHIGP